MKTPENKKKAVKYIIYFLIGIAAVSMRISNFPGIEIAGNPPDVLLVYAVAVSFCSGDRVGGVFGLFVGTLVACAGGYRITVAPIFYMLIGYFAVILARELLGFTGTEIIPISLTFASALVCKICYVITGAALNTKNVNIFRVFADTALPEAAATLIAGVIVYIPIFLFVMFRSRKNKFKFFSHI